MKWDFQKINTNFHLFFLTPVLEFFHNFRYHYAILALLPFLAGILSGSAFYEKSYLFTIIPLLLLVSGFSLVISKNILKKRVLFWFLIAPIGFYLALQAHNAPLKSGFQPFYGKKNSSVTGVIKTEPYIKKEFWIFDLEVASVNNREVKGKIRLKVKIDKAESYQYGDSLKLTGRIRLPMTRRNPGGFDYRKYLSNRGIYAQMTQYSAAKIEVLKSHCASALMRRIIIPIRMYIRSVIDKRVEENGFLLKGLLLGEKRELPDEVRTCFKNTGMMHVLAVSGLHVGILLFIFYQLFTALFVPYRLKIILTILIIWTYATITGLGPSAVRASTMGSIILLGWALERKSFIYNSIALAAIILLSANPLNIYDVGFLLSFSATISIIYVYPKLKNSIPGMRPKNSYAKAVIDSLLVSVSAMAGTLPIIAAVFNQVAFVSIMANLFVIPLIFILAGLGILIIAFGWLSFFASAYGASAYYVTEIINRSVALFSTVPNGYQACATPGHLFILFYFLTAVCLVNLKYRKWARKGVFFSPMLFTCILVFISLFAEKPMATVTMLDVGQGDCIVIEFPDDKTFIIDGGKRDIFFDNGERIVYPYLKYKGIKRITGMVCTHPDADHVGGLIYLLDKFQVGLLIDPGYHVKTELYKNYEQLIGIKEINRMILTAGTRINLRPDIYFDVLHPQKGIQVESANESSVILRFICGEHSVLLTGDIEKGTEAMVVHAIDSLRSDILKVPHHGSSSSSTPSFVKRVKPGVAVIQAGKWNRFGHPNAEVLNRYAEQETEIYRNDLHGAVIIRLFEDRYDIQTIVK